MNQVTLTVNGRAIRAVERTALLSVLQREGIEVPTLCHHPAVKPYGACRLCLVEVKRKGRTRLTTSCNYPVLEDLEVSTESDRIQRHRKMVLELLLARCGEVESIRTLAARYGVHATELQQKAEPCILCGLCVRVCNEVVGLGVLANTGRGVSRTVGTSYGKLPDTCIGCGACAAVCPTSAVNIAMKAAERFRSLNGPDRLCRYALMGLVPGAICARSFVCETCEVEHRFAAALDTHPIMLAREVEMEPTQRYLEQRWRSRQ